jgi:hypothetical protein
MRTTIRLDDQLLKKAKEMAARRGRSLTSVIEDALRESLSCQSGSEQRKPVRLITFRGKGPLPGVVLDNSAALLDIMESSDDPRGAILWTGSFRGFPLLPPDRQHPFVAGKRHSGVDAVAGREDIPASGHSLF